MGLLRKNKAVALILGFMVSPLLLDFICLSVHVHMCCVFQGQPKLLNPDFEVNFFTASDRDDGGHEELTHSPFMCSTLLREKGSGVGVQCTMGYNDEY